MEIDDLSEEAEKVASRAYAPYSQFPVGCALLTHSGNVYTGCNVENASYGLTICAERSAIAKAVAAEGQVVIDKVVIYTPTKEPVTPCGACRQVINEFGSQARVYSFCSSSLNAEYDMKELLPGAFVLKK